MENSLAILPAPTAAIERPTRYSPARDPAGLLQSFLAKLTARTRAAYTADLEDFARWLGVSGPSAAVGWFVSLTQGEATQTGMDYMSALRDAGKSPATINRRRATLRSVLQMARSVGLAAIHLEIRPVKMEHYRDTLGPDPDKLRALLADKERLAQANNRRAVRDLAIVRLLFNRGLRKGEASSLDVCHYERQARRLSIHGKGRGNREWVTLSEKAAGALDRWLAVRGDAPGPMFIPFRGSTASAGGRLTDRQINRILEPYGIRPHGLRHAAITQALEMTDGDIPKVMRFSRHKSPTVLMIYDDRRKDGGGAVAAMLDELDRGAAKTKVRRFTDKDLSKLTPTQADVVRPLLAGSTIKATAEKLHRSCGTVKENIRRAENRLPDLHEALVLAGVHRR